MAERVPRPDAEIATLRQKALDCLKLRAIYLRQLNGIDDEINDDEESPNHGAFIATQESMISRAAVSHAFSAIHSSSDEQVGNSIIEISEHEQELHQELLKKHEEVCRLKHELAKLKEKSFGVILNTRELWGKLEVMKIAGNDIVPQHASLKRLKSKVDGNVQLTKIVLQVFQRLILASKIDWAQDEVLTNVMLDDVNNLFN